MPLNRKPEYLRFCAIANAGVAILLAAYFFLAPFFILTQDLRDPGLSNGDIPEFAFRWHKQLSKKYEAWAEDRVRTGAAVHLTQDDVSGTEWPMFSSVFYLWATEPLQLAWDQNTALSASMPKEYARGAIAAAGALVTDPNNATWVSRYWGDNYLNEENAFYRMLLISGLTSYQRLSDDVQYQALLLSQVESLAKEIDDSPAGLLDDYPGQCYPVDVLPAISAIRRADEVLGTDHSRIAARAVRGFEGAALDSGTGLPAYIADSKTGQGYGPARGVGISYMLIWAAELWPETAARWYQDFTTHFWNEGSFLAGFRELPHNSDSNGWFVDVDAGPVIAGYGTAASAFGIGAARTHGRFDHAYPLSAQALVTAWPLPDGTLLIPRLLSNLSDAPFVGEAALLFSFTRQPLTGTLVDDPLRLPWLVYVLLLTYAGIGVSIIASAALSARRWLREDIHLHGDTTARQQLATWVTLIVLGVFSAVLFSAYLGILFLILAQRFPGARPKG